MKTTSVCEESPYAAWLAEWLRPQVAERSLGFIRIRDGKLSFVGQIGRVDWELDLANVKQFAAINGGRALSVASVAGEEFVVSILEPNLMQEAPRKAIAAIERALLSLATNRCQAG